MKIMLICFVVIAAIIALAIMSLAAPEVTTAQRLLLGSIPLAISLTIAWAAWKET